jgi:hypothetical protein
MLKNKNKNTNTPKNKHRFGRIYIDITALDNRCNIIYIATESISQLRGRQEIHERLVATKT